MRRKRWMLAAVPILLMACANGEDGSEDGSDGGRSMVGSDAGEPAGLDRVEAYIRSDRFTGLVFEVDAVPGLELETGVLSDVATRFESLLSKPDGIEVRSGGVLAPGGTDRAWTFTELRALAEDSFDLAVSADSIKVHVLSIDGHYAEDDESSKTLGLAWDNQNIVIFTEVIQDLCQSSGLLIALRGELCDRALRAVLTHEMGHVIGLVDNGLPMVTPHRDEAHGSHDVDEDCVMYFAHEGDGLLQLLGQRVVSREMTRLDFDDACLADIAAVRDR